MASPESAPMPGVIAAAIDEEIIDGLWGSLEPQFASATSELARKLVTPEGEPRLQSAFMACTQSGFKAGASLASQAIDALASSGAIRLPDAPTNFGLLRAVVGELRAREGACNVCQSPWADHTDPQLLRCANADWRPPAATSGPVTGERPRAPTVRRAPATGLPRFAGVKVVSADSTADMAAAVEAAIREQTARPIDRLVRALRAWSERIQAHAGEVDADNERDWGDMAYGFLVGFGVERRHVPWYLLTEMARDAETVEANAEALGCLAAALPMPPLHGGLIAGAVTDLTEMLSDPIGNSYFAIRLHGAEPLYVANVSYQGTRRLVLRRGGASINDDAWTPTSEPAWDGDGWDGDGAQLGDLIVLANDGDPVGGW